MKDQVMALRWVRKNIHNFGGNPNSVTIAGSSAGASSVHLHLLSPLSKGHHLDKLAILLDISIHFEFFSTGLYHKAIMHSGTSLQPWLLMDKTVANVTKKHAQMLGCPILSSKEMVSCLRQRPAARIASLNQETMVILVFFEEILGGS